MSSEDFLISSNSNMLSCSAFMPIFELSQSRWRMPAYAMDCGLVEAESARWITETKESRLTYLPDRKYSLAKSKRAGLLASVTESCFPNKIYYTKARTVCQSFRDGAVVKFQ